MSNTLHNTTKNRQRVFIFIGNSGCGKGTQAQLLREQMEQKGMDILRLELGGKFREFWHKSGYTAERSAGLSEAGALQPEFLAIHIWSHTLIDFFTGDKHLIGDGVPRREREAKVLDGAFRFYGIESPTVIYLDISREVAKERMLGRGRMDDDAEAVENRLDWFDKEVIPTIEFLENDSYYDFIKINAEQSIEEIHADIMSAVKL